MSPGLRTIRRGWRRPEPPRCARAILRACRPAPVVARQQIRYDTGEQVTFDAFRAIRHLFTRNIELASDVDKTVDNMIGGQAFSFLLDGIHVCVAGSGESAAVSHHDLTTVLTTMMTTVGLPDTSTYTTTELVSSLAWLLGFRLLGRCLGRMRYRETVIEVREIPRPWLDGRDLREVWPGLSGTDRKTVRYAVAVVIWTGHVRSG